MALRNRELHARNDDDTDRLLDNGIGHTWSLARLQSCGKKPDRVCLCDVVCVAHRMRSFVSTWLSTVICLLVPTDASAATHFASVALWNWLQLLPLQQSWAIILSMTRHSVHFGPEHAKLTTSLKHSYYTL